MLVALLIGILIGRRCQVSSALKDLLDAAKRAVAQAAGDDGAGDDEADADNEDDETTQQELLQVRPFPFGVVLAYTSLGAHPSPSAPLPCRRCSDGSAGRGS